MCLAINIIQMCIHSLGNNNLPLHNIVQYTGTLQLQKINKRKDEVKRPPKYPGKAPVDPKKLENHSRGEGLDAQKVKHPLHAAKLRKRENKLHYAQKQAARAEILLTEQQG